MGRAPCSTCARSAALDRFLVYGYSPTISVLTWDGLLSLTTYGGSRAEVPFDLPPLSGTVALLTGYQVRGELVLRAELEAYAGPAGDGRRGVRPLVRAGWTAGCRRADPQDRHEACSWPSSTRPSSLHR